MTGILITMMAMRRALCLLTALLVTAIGGEAHADPENGEASATDPYASAWEIAGKASYLAPPIRGAANPFGAGFGGRLGYSFGHLYVGAMIVDYLGGKDVDLQTQALIYDAELGVQFRARLGTSSLLTFRPTVGLGGITVAYTTPNTAASGGNNVDVVSNASGGGGSNSNTTTTMAFLFQPGATLMLSSGWTFAALKGTAAIVPNMPDGFGGSGTWLAWGLDGELGIRW